MTDQYTVGELAEVAGVSRRTVRYYVQEQLLPSPHGRGRGAYYDGGHLDRLLRVKAMQERGMSLLEIHQALDPGRAESPAPPEIPRIRPPRSLWTRIEIGPGVELHLAAGRRPPSPARLRELMEWCCRHIRSSNEPGSNEAEE